MDLKPVYIEATTIPDAWFQCIWALIDNGFTYEIQHGSYVGDKRLEFDWITVYIKQPWARPLEPDIPVHFNIPNPVEPGYIEQYIPYLMTGEKKPGEDYTYGQRICAGDHFIKECDDEDENGGIDCRWSHRTVNQIEHFIELLKKTPNTNQAILQVGQPSDCLLVDPPCLRHLDMRVKDGRLIFYPYFRCIDANERIIYKIEDEIYFDTLNSLYEKHHNGSDVFVLSCDLDKKIMVWGKVKASSRRYANNIKNYKMRDGASVKMTDEHWIFNKRFDLVQARDIVEKDNSMVRFSNCLDLEVNGNINRFNIIDLLKNYKDYYLRNLTLNEVKSFSNGTVKESWRDKRILPFCEIKDINILPDNITIGAARSKYFRNKYLNLTENLGYIWGAFEADGWFTKNSLRIAFSSKFNDRLTEKFSKILKEENINFITYYYKNAVVFSLGDKIFRDITESLGFIHGAHIKRVPSWVLNSPKDFKRGLIDGWMDGDAGVTVNSDLAVDMMVVASLAGISTSLYEEKERTAYIKGRAIHASKCYRIHKVNGVRNRIENNIIYKRVENIDKLYSCGNVIDLEIEKYGNFCVGNGNIIVHNSWDLWGGFPANLGGIVYLQEYMAGEIGVEPGPFICASKGMHIYKYVWELASIRTGKSIEELKKGTK